MSIDFNQKLAWVLRDLADSNLDVLALAELRTQLVTSQTEAVSVGPYDHWLTSAADRVPFTTAGASSAVTVDWAAHPELTHPLAKSRLRCEPFDLQATQNTIKELLTEASERFHREPRRILLWMWRYLPERLAGSKEGPGPIATQIAADARLPNISIWQRIAFDSALYSAGSSPAFLTLQLGFPLEALEACYTKNDLFNACAINAELMWQAMLPIVQQLGPEVFLNPCLVGHPRVDAWLTEQGVTDNIISSETELNSDIAGDLPNSVVALVPSDCAKSLGEACVNSFQAAYEKIRNTIRDHLVKEGWTKASNKTFSAVWERQTANAWRLCWTSVPWSNDSSGVGTLVSKSEVTIHEKWARTNEDAAGLDDPWPGIFYGLWYQANVYASRARKNMAPAAAIYEPNPACTACGCRQALHDKKVDTSAQTVRAFWQQLAEKQTKNEPSKEADNDPVAISCNDMLCAVCTMHRMAHVTKRQPAQAQVPADNHSKTAEKKATISNGDKLALVVMQLDHPATVLRGTKELKGAPTLAESVHSKLESSFVRRARKHVKEILDTPAPLGPARHIGVQQLLADFAMTTAVDLCQKYRASVIHLTDHQLIALVEHKHAYALVRELHDSQQEPFVHVQNRGIDKIALRAGPVATSSAVVALVTKDDALGTVLAECFLALQRISRDVLGGDSLVILKRYAMQEPRIFAAHWKQLSDSMDTIVNLMSADQIRRIMRRIDSILPAISNADLDKAAAEARTDLLTAQALGPLEIPEQDACRIAAALCKLIDQCEALPQSIRQQEPIADQVHSLDGLHIAASLCEGAER